MGSVNVAEVLTLDWLKQRSEEVGECLVWKLSCSHGTQPTVRIGGRKGRMVLVRREAWALTHGRPMAPDHVPRMSCGTPKCTHPDHIEAIPRGELPRAGCIAPAAVETPDPTARPIDAAAFEAIATAQEPNDTLAQRLGRTETAIAALRLLHAWCTPTPPACQAGA